MKSCVTKTQKKRLKCSLESETRNVIKYAGTENLAMKKPNIKAFHSRKP